MGDRKLRQFTPWEEIEGKALRRGGSPGAVTTGAGAGWFHESQHVFPRIGKQVADIMDAGKLVSDDIVIALIEEKLSGGSAKNGAVFDGFPRTVAQAEALDRRLADLGTPLEAALSFDVTEEELLRRLAGRAVAQHRADDVEQTIRHRLEVFAIKTRPLIDYYRHRRLLTMVDGVGPVQEVTDRILSGLPSANGGRDPAFALAV